MGPPSWPAPPPRAAPRDRSRSPNSGRPTWTTFDQEDERTRAIQYCSIISIADGCATPQEALSHATANPSTIFWQSDDARRVRHKTSRYTGIAPCNRRTFSKSDAALTYSYGEECFYVVELTGAGELNQGYKELAGHASGESGADISLYLAQEGNITFEQLSAEHQKEFLAARQKEANRLLSAGAVRILNDEESLQFEEQYPECVLDSLWTERWKATDEQKGVVSQIAVVCCWLAGSGHTRNREKLGDARGRSN